MIDLDLMLLFSIVCLSYCPDSLTAEDIVKLDIIKIEVLLAEKTLEQRKARVNKYLQWVSESCKMLEGFMI